MRALAIIGLAVAMTAAGCRSHYFLQRNATRQTLTATDIIQQQVLDNVACFAANPDTLPSFATIGQGVTQTQDGGFMTPTPAWNATTFTGLVMPLNASRQLMENWTLQPVMGGGRMRRVRCAFQMLFNRPDIYVGADCCSVCTSAGCVNCLQELINVGVLPAPSDVQEGANNKPVDNCWRFSDSEKAAEYAQKLQAAVDCHVPTGWFCVGKDAPKGACQVGTCCDTHAWVIAGGHDAFSRFTITVLTLATTDPTPKKTPDEIILTIQETAKQLRALEEQRNLVPNKATDQAINDLEAEIRRLIPQLRSSSAPESAFDRPPTQPLSTGGGIQYVAPLPGQ